MKNLCVLVCPRRLRFSRKPKVEFPSEVDRVFGKGCSALYDMMEHLGIRMLVGNGQ